MSNLGLAWHRARWEQMRNLAQTYARNARGSDHFFYGVPPEVIGLPIDPLVGLKDPFVEERNFWDAMCALRRSFPDSAANITEDSLLVLVDGEYVKVSSVPENKGGSATNNMELTKAQSKTDWFSPF